MDFVPSLIFEFFSLSSLARKPHGEKRSETIIYNKQQKGELCLG